MHLHLQMCLAFLYTTLLYSAATVPAANTTRQDLELSALPDRPDQNFRHEVAYREGHSLPENAIIMVCVAAMQEIAHLDTDAYVSNTKSWVHPEYPGVALSVLAEGGRTMSVRFARWLIHAAMRDMMFRDRYEMSVSRGWYREDFIGGITFYPEPDGSAQQSLVSPPPNASSGIAFSFQHGQSGTTGISTLGDQLHAYVEYEGKAMDKRDTFLSIIWLLLALGGRGGELLRSLYVKTKAITVEVRTIWNSISRPGTEQYIVTCGDLINMLARLAVILQKENRFSEMNVIIREGQGKPEIARGAIRTKPMPPRTRITVPGTMNVTTS
ncbi:MAG: hypothetical protein Q9224_005066 [Gallowayella concinna]